MDDFCVYWDYFSLYRISFYACVHTKQVNNMSQIRYETNATENYIMKKDSKKNQAAAPFYSVTGCHFVGVQYDAKAVESINLIAEGLIENAQGLSKLAEVLKASNVQIDAMVKLPSN
jgi:hypothetical protein